MSKQLGIKNAEKFPEGFRAVWDEAYKLVTCKHHADIGTDDHDDEKCHELVNRSSPVGDPDYIEAHHWEGFPASKIFKIVFSPNKHTNEKDKLAWKMVKLQVAAMHNHIVCEET